MSKKYTLQNLIKKPETELERIKQEIIILKNTDQKKLKLCNEILELQNEVLGEE